MSNPVVALKDHLSHIKPSSLRYKITKEVWGEERIKKSKACKFYWVMIPSSTILTIIFGVLAAIIIPLMIVIGWFIGRVPTFFDDKTGNSRVADDVIWYEYKYAPRKGTFHKVAPWQVIVPLGVLYMLWTGAQVGVFDSIGHWFAHNLVIWFGDWWVVLVSIATFFGLCYLIGIALTRNRQTLSALWNRLCPDLVVEETDAAT